jgi:hypothetical protein
MPRLIALAQRKGGVGKATLAVSLAAELCDRGLDVALVDSDPQRSAWAWASALWSSLSGPSATLRERYGLCLGGGRAIGAGGYDHHRYAAGREGGRGICGALGA